MAARPQSHKSSWIDFRNATLLARDTEDSRSGYGVALLTLAPPVSGERAFASVHTKVLSQVTRHEATIAKSAAQREMLKA